MVEESSQVRELINEVINTGVFVDPEFLQDLPPKEEFLKVYPLLISPENQGAVLNKELYQQLLTKTQQHGAEPSGSTQYSVRLKFSYKDNTKRRETQDFVTFFNSRYAAIQKMLLSRQELGSATSISRVIGKRDRERVAIIGMVSEKQATKNKNILLTLEDPTGTIKALISRRFFLERNKKDILEEANSIVEDEIIGVTGQCNDNMFFVDNIVWPDVPLMPNIKTAEEEVYAIFLSDLHVGSKNFLSEHFEKFLNWLNQELGSEEQRRIASLVRYVFIVGDLVDGVGVYPEQDEELEIKDIYAQYKKCAELLSRIPKNIAIILCPGNHDAMRIAEPQPPLYKDFAKPIYALPNVFLVSNPAVVNIHYSDTFSGFDVLLYHGYSFDYYVANVDAIRVEGGYDRADLIMKFLLKRRHLAPTHASTLYIPDTKEDPLVIKEPPDFFVTGHIHKSAVSNYKGTTLVCGSCWQSKTVFQERVGHNPEPCRVPIVNLKTRKMKILRF